LPFAFIPLPLSFSLEPGAPRRSIRRQSFHSHNFQRIGGWAGTRPQFIIKYHFSFSNFFSEVTIGDIGKIIRQFNEFQIMGGDQPRTVLADQVANLGRLPTSLPRLFVPNFLSFGSSLTYADNAIHDGSMAESRLGVKAAMIALFLY